ncbi:hypothetical protein Agub_g5477 [Astrephomene gubernaculifera]|uniref:SBP-type domain-containing protein n=1 Tax=Astrephomene gubernaculifera TaxID=47775 RepID=A0AAD3HKP1_9CHLO|nr:hypothetical protein Agub_g5477 [Astrephomene gubernaculifera]
MERVHAQWPPAIFDNVTPSVEAYDARNANKRRRPPGKSNCQVPGCAADLKELKPYFRRHSICMAHMKAPYVVIHGVKMRYCQQCGHFEDLECFGGANRSCKMSLERRSNMAASKFSGSGRFSKVRHQLDISSSDNATDNSTISRTWNGTAAEAEVETDMRSQLEPQAKSAALRAVDLAMESSNQGLVLANHPTAGSDFSFATARPNPLPACAGGRANISGSPTPPTLPSNAAGDSDIFPLTTLSEDGTVHLRLPRQPTPPVVPPVPQLRPPQLQAATSRQLPPLVLTPRISSGELPHTHSLGCDNAEAAASCGGGGGGGWGGHGGGAGAGRSPEVRSGLMYSNPHYASIDIARNNELGAQPQPQALPASRLQQHRPAVQLSLQLDLSQPAPRQQPHSQQPQSTALADEVLLMALLSAVGARRKCGIPSMRSEWTAPGAWY